MTKPIDTDELRRLIEASTNPKNPFNYTFASRLQLESHLFNNALQIANELDALREDNNHLREQRDLFQELACEWRGFSIDQACIGCGGSGSKGYADTSTWRGDIGGQVITVDVCDTCWGSGRKDKPWPPRSPENPND